MLNRLLTVVPVVKLATSLIAWAFWATCAQWGECSWWLGVSWINMQLIHETCYFLGFVLIAKGWCITRQTFDREEVRRALARRSSLCWRPWWRPWTEARVAGARSRELPAPMVARCRPPGA